MAYIKRYGARKELIRDVPLAFSSGNEEVGHRFGCNIDNIAVSFTEMEIEVLIKRWQGMLEILAERRSVGKAK